MWQDIVLGLSIWVLLVALLPTIFHPTKKPTLSTSLITGSALIAIASAYVSLEFWWSALPSALIAGAWLLLAYQRYRLDKRSSESI